MTSKGKEIAWTVAEEVRLLEVGNTRETIDEEILILLAVGCSNRIVNSRSLR